jgi:hypothetical protein
LPIKASACSGSSIPGSCTLIFHSPWRWTSGSVTPSRLMRSLMMLIAWSTPSLVRGAWGVSCASRMTDKPPCRSRPSFVLEPGG